MSSIFTCSLKSFSKKLGLGEKEMSAKDRQIIFNKMDSLAKEWDTGKWNNVKDANWNNWDTFKWLFKKYTKKEIDPEYQINFKDVRKFEAGLNYYNQLIAKPKGAVMRYFHLPRTALQNVPELKRFETELTNETQFFRDFQVQSDKQIKEFLSEFKDFSLSFGAKSLMPKGLKSGGDIEVERLNKEYDSLVKQYNQPKLTYAQRTSIKDKMNTNRNEMLKFLEAGSGEAYVILNSVLQGADINTIEGLDRSGKIRLNKMMDNYKEIRKSSSISLLRGLQKIKAMAKQKDMVWADGVAKRIESMVHNIEFQKSVDESGRPLNYNDQQLIDDRMFLERGIKLDRDYVNNGKISLSKGYMPRYTLGLLDIVKQFSFAVENNKNILDTINQEINSFDKIVDRAKGRTDLVDNQYSANPWYFLKKYTNDVGTFNYKTHVKATYIDASKNLMDYHLKPAEALGRKDLVDTAESMLDLLTDVYNSIDSRDPSQDGTMMNLTRMMTSYTYFRLMGGNLRSAARNATQRLFEWTEYGHKARKDSKAWYVESGNASANKDMFERQSKKYGLQWHDGKSVKSTVLDAIFKSDADVSTATRGAIDEAYLTDSKLFVDQNGELQIRGKEKVSAKAARTVSQIATKTSWAHRIVEDWNRSGTFKIAFGLAFQNIKQLGDDYVARKMLSQAEVEAIRNVKGEGYQVTRADLLEKFKGDNSLVDSKINNYIENTSGRIAYNSVLDLHFEYAKWAKSKIIRADSDDSAVAFAAKQGVGQFQHYKFNMRGMMLRWAKEAGISIKAGDYRSEEVWRPIRYGIMRATIWAATMAGGLDLMNLASDAVYDEANAMYLWLTTDRDNPDEMKKLKDVTFEQEGAYFLGPNIGVILDAYEIFDFAKPESNQTYTDVHTPALVHSMNKNEIKDENFKKAMLLNTSLARIGNYTQNAFFAGSGIKDAFMVEAGLYLKKDQREFRNWMMRGLYDITGGTIGKKPKKLKVKSLSMQERIGAINSIDLFNR